MDPTSGGSIARQVAGRLVAGLLFCVLAVVALVVLFSALVAFQIMGVVLRAGFGLSIVFAMLRLLLGGRP